MANKPWISMSGQMNIIGVSHPNQIKQNNSMTIHMWSCCYKAGCHQIVGSPVLQKSYIIFMSLVLVTLSLLPVALYHYNKVTIGFVIYKKFNRQMSNSKMAAKLEDGAPQLKLLVWVISTTIQNNQTSAQTCIWLAYIQGLAAGLLSVVHGRKQCRLYVCSLLCQRKLSEIV